MANHPRDFYDLHTAAACTAVCEPARRCVRCSFRTAWHWVEDVAGALALFALLIGGIWVAHGSGLPTGGDQLVQEAR